MKNKNILVILPAQNFSEHEFVITKTVLSRGGLKLFVASDAVGLCIGDNNLKVKADMNTSQVQTFGGSTVSTWNWTFQDGTPSASTQANPQVTFSSSGDKQVTLQAADSDTYSCSAAKTVKVGYPLPKWKEVTPTTP